MNKQLTAIFKRFFLALVSYELLFIGLFILFFWWMSGFTSSSSDQLAFKFPERLSLLYGIVVLIGFYAFIIFFKYRKLALIGEERVVHMMVKPLRAKKLFLSYFFLRNAYVFMVFALAQPVFGSKKVSGTLETMELVLAIDISSSMNVKDLDQEYSRLDVVKRSMNQLVNNLHGERVAIVAFAGTAFLQLPLTNDYAAAKMFIDEIESNMISMQGTNIPAALELSASTFTDAKTSKAIVLVSDGENHEEGLETASALIKEKEISLAVLGIGTEQGGLIPNDPKRHELGYKTTETGQTIVSKMNPRLMREIANSAGGFVYVNKNAYPDLSEILSQLKHLKRSKVEGIDFDVKENWYQIPLFLGLLFLIGFSTLPKWS